MTTWNRKLVFEKILNMISTKGFITTEELADSFQVELKGTKKSFIVKMSKRAARRYLKEFADKGLLVSAKIGKTWQWKSIIPINKFEVELNKLAKST